MQKRKSQFSISAGVLLISTVFLGANMAEAKRVPTAVSVCINPSTNVVSRVADNEACAGGTQVWSASKLAPQLCWNASSLVPTNRTRIVTLANDGKCAAPLRLIPSGVVKLLCVDQSSGNLHWPVTRACEPGNAPIWVRTAAATKATPIVSANPATPVIPVVTLESTVIRGNTWPKAVSVTTNVEGTVYFVEGNRSINSVTDITSLPVSRWTTGKITKPNAATLLTLNVDDLLNGYYRVYVVDAQGVLSAPANNLVTISITRAYETSVTVRTQTLDQSYPTWHTSNWSSGVSSSQSMGQSFTAGLTGPLSRVSLGLTRTGTVTQITAEIYAADGTGNATGSALASKTITGTTVPTSPGGSLTNFDFSSPVSVTAGTKYVIVLTTPDQNAGMGGGGGQYSIYNENGNSYSGGNGIGRPLTTQTVNNDFVFQTYVDV